MLCNRSIIIVNNANIVLLVLNGVDWPTRLLPFVTFAVLCSVTRPFLGVYLCS